MINYYKSKLEYKENTAKNDEISINCPQCGDNKFHLGINFTMKVFNCFKCSFHGKLSYLTKLLFNIKQEDVFENNPIVNVKTIKDINKKPITLPLDFRCLTDTMNIIYTKHFDYLFSRKISLIQIKQYNIGTSDKHKGYIFIPIYDVKKNQVYWVTRAIKKDVELKSILPKREDGFYAKSDCLFNIDKAINYDEVYICEGVFDAISIGKNAIAIMGKFLSENQFKTLIQCQFKRYIVALDNNAKKEMYDIADKLKQYAEDIFITKYPDNRDINELYQDDLLHKLRYFKYTGLKDF